jgi:GNAT superfamily N-acetyltransferase
MTYNPTVDEDIQAHDQMHNRRNPITTKRILDNPLWDTARIDGIHAIYVNRRHPERNERKWFEHALDMLVDHGLKDSFSLDLWKSMYVNQRKLAQYKIYVYLIDDKIVSIALAKRIFKAGSFYSGWKTHDASGKLAIPDRSKTQEYVDMDWSFPVVVSIDRLWTDPAHHRRGFATALLEQLRGDWVFGTHLSKKLIAFSIPTAQGKKFATKYFRGVFPGCPFVVDPYDAPMVLEDGVLKNDYELKRVKSGLMFSTEDLN